MASLLGLLQSALIFKRVVTQQLILHLSEDERKCSGLPFLDYGCLAFCPRSVLRIDKRSNRHTSATATVTNVTLDVDCLVAKRFIVAG